MRCHGAPAGRGDRASEPSDRMDRSSDRAGGLGDRARGSSDRAGGLSERAGGPRERAGGPSDRVQSVSRAFRILEEVGRSPAPLPVKAIARRCHLNLSTTYHLVRTLCYEGYLYRLPDGDYAIGLSLADRFHDLVGALAQPPRVHAVLRQLAETTRHSAYVGRFVQGRMVITDLVEGPRSPYLEDLQVGLPTAAHATAVGKALLATLPAARRRGYLADQGLRPFTGNTVVDVDELEAEVAEIRASEPVIEHGQFRPEVSCAAALVRSGDAVDPWWALVVSARSLDLPPALVDCLLAAAGDLTGAAAGRRATPT
jgi:DNA-binding IclR family transcriptional regulator